MSGYPTRSLHPRISLGALTALARRQIIRKFSAREQQSILLSGERPMTFRYATIVTTLIVLALPAPAQKSNIRADNIPEVVESVKKFELELCDIIVRGEWDAYASRLTDDYVRILSGKIQSKEEVLNEFRTSNTKTISMVPEQMDVRIYGDTAITIIQLRSREQTPEGPTIDHRGRPTKVFVRRNGKWFLAQLTGSPLN